jgi:putative endonuclease
MGSTQTIGARGEEAAAGYLLREGFTLLHRNWRNGRYELDIVARKGETIHFVEVKCRRKGGLTAPEDAITKHKFESLRRAADLYLAEYGIDLDSQFDLIAIEYDHNGMDLKYVPGAMTPHW